MVKVERNLQKYALVFLVLMLLGLDGFAEGKPVPTQLDADEKSGIVEELSLIIEKNYIYPDKAKKIISYIQRAQKSSKIAGDDSAEFSQSLTKLLQEVSKDKHLRVNPAFARHSQVPSGNEILENWYSSYRWVKTNLNGVEEVKVIKPNIGYFILTSFSPLDRSKDKLDAAMKLLETSDAIIIDIRSNMGGDPFAVQYLCSFFFNERVLLNSLYWRKGDKVEAQEFWTLSEVEGLKRPDVPLFVLTSPATFSAAEEFAYNLQTRKRATIIGSVTGGGANPGGIFAIGQGLEAFIPTGRAENPVTKTNWDGKGVQPDHDVPGYEQMDLALELANKAAMTYENNRREATLPILEKLWDKLVAAQNHIDRGKSQKAEKTVAETLDWAISEGLIDALGIEWLAGEYRNSYKQPELADLISAYNTR